VLVAGRAGRPVAAGGAVGARGGERAIRAARAIGSRWAFLPIGSAPAFGSWRAAVAFGARGAALGAGRAFGARAARRAIEAVCIGMPEPVWQARLGRSPQGPAPIREEQGADAAPAAAAVAVGAAA